MRQSAPDYTDLLRYENSRRALSCERYKFEPKHYTQWSEKRCHLFGHRMPIRSLTRAVSMLEISRGLATHLTLSNEPERICFFIENFYQHINYFLTQFSSLNAGNILLNKISHSSNVCRSVPAIPFGAGHAFIPSAGYKVSIERATSASLQSSQASYSSGGTITRLRFSSPGL